MMFVVMLMIMMLILVLIMIVIIMVMILVYVENSFDYENISINFMNNFLLAHLFIITARNIEQHKNFGSCQRHGKVPKW